MSARVWGAVVPGLGLAACANLWGFEDLRGSDGARTDATATAADPPDGTGADGQTVADDATDPDGGVTADDAAPALDASRASDAPPEAQGGALTDAMIVCQAHCPDGCCDSNGVCQTAEGISACGKGGAACQDCTQTSCWPISPCCSPSKKACACAPAAVCP